MAELHRSWLFSPGSHPDRCMKALASGADQTIWDLEDSVAMDLKEEARSRVRALLNTVHHRMPWVRVNPLTSDLGRRDVEQVAPAVNVVAGRWVIPKADAATARVLHSMRSQGCFDGELLLLIETAEGLSDLLDPRLRALWRSLAPARLAFGGLDLTEDLGGRTDGEDIYLFPRTQISLVSRVLGWPPPVDTVYPKIDDLPGLEESTRRGRRLGFAGKLIIHPRQVEPVHGVFRPTSGELAWASEVMNAAASSEGAVRVAGEMVDLPVIKAARRILENFEGEQSEQPH